MAVDGPGLGEDIRADIDAQIVTEASWEAQLKVDVLAMLKAEIGAAEWDSFIANDDGTTKLDRIGQGISNAIVPHLRQLVNSTAEQVWKHVDEGSILTPRSDSFTVVLPTNSFVLTNAVPSYLIESVQAFRNGLQIERVVAVPVGASQYVVVDTAFSTGANLDVGEELIVKYWT